MCKCKCVSASVSASVSVRVTDIIFMTRNGRGSYNLLVKTTYKGSTDNASLTFTPDVLKNNVKFLTGCPL